jgi:glycosyltransferase involved in cell wall biosynthesis
MRRSILNDIGGFDVNSFGRGYGEENDYCLRAIKAGYKNIFALDVFVYHIGQVSFAPFASGYSKNQMILAAKHADYELRVKNYLDADLAKDARMRMDLYRLARKFGSRTAVFVTHVMKGGIEIHVRRLTARLAHDGFSVVYFNLDQGDAEYLSITIESGESIYAPSLEKISIAKHRETIADFLSWLNPDILHVHSFVGLSWHATLHLMKIIKSSRISYACTIHDYSAVCHRNHLVTREGFFCGLPPPDVCDACIRSDPDTPSYTHPIARREAYAHFLREAYLVIAPSDDTAKRLSAVFPSVKFTVRPHEEYSEIAKVAPTATSVSAKLRVAIVGAIGSHKGADVVRNLALDAKQRGLAVEFAIIGYSSIDTDTLENLGIEQTGLYASEAEALFHLRRLQPDLALFPSIWPETYCYALTLALDAGVFPVVFDLGAQAERLKNYDVGRVLDVSLVDRPSDLNDALLELHCENRPIREVRFATYPNIREYYYGSAEAKFSELSISGV